MPLLRRLVPLALPVLIAVAAAHAQEVVWSRTYGGEGKQTAFAADRTLDGGFVLWGYQETPTGDDFLLIRTDDGGEPVWAASWDGVDTDWGFAVRQLAGGDIAVAGMSGANNGGHDMYLARVGPDGTRLWERFYGDAGIDERAHSVTPTSDGGFVLAGQKWVQPGEFGSYDVWVVKTDAAGQELWARTYSLGDSGNDVGLAIEEVEGGGYIVGGVTQSSDWACYLLRLDPLGTLLWEGTYGGGFAGGECNDVEPTADGGFVGVGCATPSTDCEVYLVKVDAAGVIEWERTYGGAADDVGEALLQLPSGGYVVAGRTGSEGAGSWDLYVIGADAAGNELWTRTFGGSSDDRAFQALATTDGELAVAGWLSNGADGLDALLVRYDADTALHRDDFESGDLSEWSVVQE